MPFFPNFFTSSPSSSSSSSSSSLSNPVPLPGDGDKGVQTTVSDRMENDGQVHEETRTWEDPEGRGSGRIWVKTWRRGSPSSPPTSSFTDTNYGPTKSHNDLRDTDGKKEEQGGSGELLGDRQETALPHKRNLVILDTMLRSAYRAGFHDALKLSTFMPNPNDNVSASHPSSSTGTLRSLESSQDSDDGFTALTAPFTFVPLSSRTLPTETSNPFTIPDDAYPMTPTSNNTTSTALFLFTALMAGGAATVSYRSINRLKSAERNLKEILALTELRNERSNTYLSKLGKEITALREKVEGLGEGVEGKLGTFDSGLGAVRQRIEGMDLLKTTAGQIVQTTRMEAEAGSNEKRVASGSPTAQGESLAAQVRYSPLGDSVESKPDTTSEMASTSDDGLTQTRSGMMEEVKTARSPQITALSVTNAIANEAGARTTPSDTTSSGTLTTAFEAETPSKRPQGQNKTPTAAQHDSNPARIEETDGPTRWDIEEFLKNSSVINSLPAEVKDLKTKLEEIEQKINSGWIQTDERFDRVDELQIENKQRLNGLEHTDEMLAKRISTLETQSRSKLEMKALADDLKADFARMSSLVKDNKDIFDERDKQGGAQISNLFEDVKPHTPPETDTAPQESRNAKSTSEPASASQPAETSSYPDVMPFEDIQTLVDDIKRGYLGERRSEEASPSDSHDVRSTSAEPNLTEAANAQSRSTIGEISSRKQPSSTAVPSSYDSPAQPSPAVPPDDGIPDRREARPISPPLRPEVILGVNAQHEWEFLPESPEFRPGYEQRMGYLRPILEREERITLIRRRVDGLPRIGACIRTRDGLQWTLHTKIRPTGHPAWLDVYLDGKWWTANAYQWINRDGFSFQTEMWTVMGEKDV
ncbi:hypothetical protein IAR55_001328 [Kwoniella newhampshirensis]|uniref:Peroxin-14 n=1 Tax=Kwoniella newhampshirensis TaxID=1651941 RepID=A0AAW0Z5F2_9TREE